MRGSGFAREARRRPELDLWVGPLEAASIEADQSPVVGSPLDDAELIDAEERPTPREVG